MTSSTRSFLTEAPAFLTRTWYAWAVLAVALILTAAGTAFLFRAVRNTDHERFLSHVDAVQGTLERRLETYQAMMKGVAGLFSTLRSVDRIAFQSYLAPIALRQEYTGIVGLGWIAEVENDSEDAVEAWLSSQGYADAHLWPAWDGRYERMVVLLLEPADEANRAVIGFDMNSEAVRRTAMRIARQRRLPTVSGPVQLKQDHTQGGPVGCLVYLPVFDSPTSSTVHGFVYAPFRVHELFTSVSESLRQSGLGLRIVDESGEGLYAMSGQMADGQHEVRTIDVLGRRWTLEFFTTLDFERRSGRTLVWMFAAAGFTLGGGLFLLARNQSRALLENAKLYVRARTARREAELSLDINQLLASSLDAQSVAQAVINAGRELTGAGMGGFFRIALDGPAVGSVLAYAVSGVSQPVADAPALGRLAMAYAQQVIGSGMVRGTCHPDGAGSLLAVVVRSRTGTPLGIMIFVHPEPSHFTTDHERLLQRLSAPAAIAFDNARLFEAERDARRVAARRAEDLGQANAELQQFVYVSSHDLQEPLRTITQYLDILRRRHAAHLDGEARRYVDYAADSAERMYGLLNDLLSYARLGRENQRTPTDLAVLVDEVLQDLKAAIQESGTRIDIEALPALRCDRSKVRSLFQNLLSNAIKFRRPQFPAVRLASERDAHGCWIITVIDNGPGIPLEHREAVFELFHRLHDRDTYPGTGIGLAICRKIVEQHGGRIWIEDGDAGGCAFRFTLPEDGSGPCLAIRTPS